VWFLALSVVQFPFLNGGGFVNHAIPAFRLRSDAENPYRSAAFMPNSIAADPAKPALGGGVTSHKIRNS
jgi:hypothetical protein